MTENKLDELLRTIAETLLLDSGELLRSDSYNWNEVKKSDEYKEIQQAIEKADKWDKIQKKNEGVSIFELTEGYDRYKELEKIGYGGVSKKLKSQAQKIKQLKKENKKLKALEQITAKFLEKCKDKDISEIPSNYLVTQLYHDLKALEDLQH